LPAVRTKWRRVAALDRGVCKGGHSSYLFQYGRKQQFSQNQNAQRAKARTFSKHALSQKAGISAAGRKDNNNIIVKKSTKSKKIKK